MGNQAHVPHFMRRRSLNGEGVRITGPAEVVEQMRLAAQRLAEQYGNKRRRLAGERAAARVAHA